MGALRVAIDHHVRAGALRVEGSDLRDTVTGSLGHLGAVISTESGIKLDVHVVAALALRVEFAAGSLDEGESTAVMVRCVVATSHEDDFISAGCVELRARSLSGGEGRESAQGEAVSDAEGHD